MKFPWEMPHWQQKFVYVVAKAEMLQGVFAVLKYFIWKNNSCDCSLIALLHCPFPLTPPLQASGSPGFAYGDLFIILMEKPSYGNNLWSWMIWSGLNWFKGSFKSICTTTKCLCELLSHIVTYHFTPSLTFFAWKKKKKKKREKALKTIKIQLDLRL